MSESVKALSIFSSLAASETTYRNKSEASVTVRPEESRLQIPPECLIISRVIFGVYKYTGNQL